jgi:hypothetical protein
MKENLLIRFTSPIATCGGREREDDLPSVQNSSCHMGIFQDRSRFITAGLSEVEKWYPRPLMRATGTPS